MVSHWWPCVCPSVFLFPDDNWSNCKWILTKLCMCIDVAEIYLEIANGQISSVLTLSSRDTIMAGYYHFIFLFFVPKYKHHLFYYFLTYIMVAMVENSHLRS